MDRSIIEIHSIVTKWTVGISQREYKMRPYGVAFPMTYADEKNVRWKGQVIG